MSSPTITTWMNQEKPSFENFNEFITLRLEDGIFRSLAEKMKRDLAARKETSVELPWGTYSAEVKAAGEGGVISPTFEPSKNFLKMLTDDTGTSHDRRQDTFDPEYVQLLKDYVAYGYFDPDDPDNADRPAKEKGVRMADDEVDYFLNGYCNVLVTIARDKQRAGKTFRLEIDEAFPHGSFDFEYGEDGDIKVKFIAHKVFKQSLKDDTAGSNAREADFTAAAAHTTVIRFKSKKKADDNICMSLNPTGKKHKEPDKSEISASATSLSKGRTGKKGNAKKMGSGGFMTLIPRK